MSKAYCVRFYLQTPLAFHGHSAIAPLMLDGILGYAWAVEKGLTKTPAESLSPKTVTLPELPLDKISKDCYAASAGFISEDATLQATKIVKAADWKTGKSGLFPETNLTARSSGWKKAYMEDYWLLATPHIDFYFRGDIEKVASLLRIIKAGKFLGSKRGSGYGEIKKIEIDTSEDFSTEKDGYPTRNIPIDLFSNLHGLKPEMKGYRPPYWMTHLHTMCYVPQVSQWLPSSNKTQLPAITKKIIERIERSALNAQNRNNCQVAHG